MQHSDFRQLRESRLKAHLQPETFALEQAHIIFGNIAVQTRKIPTARSANGYAVKYQAVVLKCVHSDRQRLSHLAQALPPVVMIPPNQHLSPRQRR